MTTSSENLAAFGLRVAPFSKEIGDGDLWLPESKAALVSDIEEALAERQSVLLLGEPGVGKTCVLRALRHRLPQTGFRLTYCRNATLGRRDFYRLLCHTLGLQPTSSAANLFLAVETHVQDLRRDKIHPVFLLDEAHLLHSDMLAHLHITTSGTPKPCSPCCWLDCRSSKATCSGVRIAPCSLASITASSFHPPVPRTPPNTCATGSAVPAPTAPSSLMTLSLHCTSYRRDRCAKSTASLRLRFATPRGERRSSSIATSSLALASRS